MDKSFGLTKEGDKIYKVSVESSKVVQNNQGYVIDELTVEKIESLGDFYSFMFTLSNHTHIRVNRNNVVTFVEKTPPEKLNNPMAMFSDFYSHDRKVLLKTVSEKLREHFDKLAKVKNEVSKLANNCISSVDIIDSLGKIYGTEHTMTEVEFAEMAL